MIELVNHPDAKEVVGLKAIGKLKHEDYEQVVPEVEKMIEDRGKLRLVLLADEFEGWNLKAFWNELRFDARHRRDFTKVAIVGKEKWHNHAAKLSNLLMKGEIRYFDIAQVDEAWHWAAA
ncbi:STAS/SEC14 domain-containing protein [Poriferisphaera sp. WC338]|uniref:STAS/SEC14 domain-containing protein n=1 Tax=Poriferisphaera sp. WC338 TaxID=3425129 RepID=UPI003D814FA0